MGQPDWIDMVNVKVHLVSGEELDFASVQHGVRIHPVTQEVIMIDYLFLLPDKTTYVIQRESVMMFSYQESAIEAPTPSDVRKLTTVN